MTSSRSSAAGPLVRRWLVTVVAAVAATACSSPAVFSLEVGDCFQYPEGQTEVTEFEVVDCDEPHDSEVIHTFELSGDDYPEEAELIAAIDEACFGAPFEAYIGAPYGATEVEVYPIRPTPESWAEADDREVVCAAHVPGELLESSLQGTGR